MPSPAFIFDAQIHPGALSDQDLLDLAWFGVRGAVAATGDDAPDDPDELYLHLRELAAATSSRLRRAGIAPFVALGIPARRIPRRGIAALLEKLPSLIVRGRVVALGSIGLFEGGAREEEVFRAQLELANSLDLPVVVSTPVRNRLRILRRTLALLMKSELDPARVLVGGIDASSWRLVRECGFSAGLMVHPSRLTPEEAVRLIELQGASGLILASDAGAGPSDLLALPRTLHLLEMAGISPKIARRVSRDNAIDFFRIDRSLLAGP